MKMTKDKRELILRVERRKLAIRSKGLRLQDFGNKGHVSRVIHEREPNPRIRSEIADAVGVSYRTLWPK